MKGRYSMKRFVAVLSGILVLPAFADSIRDTVQPIAQPSNITSRSGATGRGAMRVSPSVRSSSDTSARNVNARTSTTSRNATQARTGIKSREVTTTSPRTTTSNNARVAQRTNTSARTATMNTPVTATVRHNTTNNPTTNIGRAATTNTRTGVRSGITARAGTVSANTNATDNTTTINQMDNLTQMTDYCKAQYMSCMDNYCNVLDDNQGRCTCSKNIKNYEKTEKALKEANEALQDVAQQIQYIGLTSDEIETLFSQTEAEIQMQATTDNSQLKNSLDSIRDLIVEVKSGTATTTDTGMSFDLSGLLDFSIGDAGFDLNAMFGSNNTNTSSISNQRGEQLYKTASARCKASVINTCQNQGVDISVITNEYDMEIDKQCIAYERSLNEANDNMNNTVRNAKTVLQKARLMVSQQKNAYDLRGCINALDSCMQDEFVCGSDYENCLDPTGKYIVNGEIVMGSMPGLVVSGSTPKAPSSDLTKSGLYKTWNYDDGGTEVNAWNNNGSLAEYIKATVKKNTKPSDTSSIMSEYLMSKIGYIDGNRTYGMCSAVLNKCRMHTFDTNGTYQHDNTVVKEYLARTMTKIKAAQDEILNDYAGECMVDVETCLDKNNYGTTNGTYSNAAINACRSQIITCMSVNGDTTQDPDPAAIKAWIDAAYNGKEETPGGSGGGTPAEPEEPENGEGNTPSETENCIMIQLVGKDNNVTRTIYQNVNKEFIFYTDDKCTNSATMTESDPTGYTFDGYYTKNDFLTQCTDEDGTFVGSSQNNCKPTSATKWYGKYTADTPTEPCVPITLNHTDLDGTALTAGKPATIYYKNSQLYTNNTCSSIFNTSTFSNMLIGINPGSDYTYEYVVDAASDTTCITNPYAYVQDIDCQPTTNTTWNIVWTAKESCVPITLDPQGGTGDTQKVYRKNNDSSTWYSDNTCNTPTTITLPTKTGYDFIAYYNAATPSSYRCTDNKGNINSQYNSECTSNPTNITWYAQWKEKCVHIELTVGNYGTGGTRDIYKKYNQSTLYSDNQCTTKLNNFEPPIRTGYVFTGYYNGPLYTAKQCMDAMGNYTNDTTNCNPNADTKWHAKYTECIEIKLESRDTTTNNVVGSSKLEKTSIYYNNGLFLDSSCSTSLIDAYSFVTDGNVDSYAGVHSADSTAYPLCIDGSKAAKYQDNTACKPTETTKWYVYFDNKSNK